MVPVCPCSEQDPTPVTESHGCSRERPRGVRQEAPAVGRAAVSFRPHQVQIAVRDDAGDASRIWMDGQVESAEFLGEFSRYRVRVGDVAVVADQPHYAGVGMLPTGTAVRLGIEPSQMRYLDA